MSGERAGLLGTARGANVLAAARAFNCAYRGCRFLVPAVGEGQADRAWAESEVALKPAVVLVTRGIRRRKGIHIRIDGPFIARDRVRVGQVVNERRDLPVPQARARTERGEVRRGQRVVGRVKLLRRGVLSRGGPFGAAFVGVIHAGEPVEAADLDSVLQSYRQGKRR